MWLAHRLARDFGVAPAFCQGALLVNYHYGDDIPDHCWLELLEISSGEILVLDLTCDQSMGLERPIVFDAKSKLEREGIHYVATDRLDVSDLPASIWKRYEILILNWMSIANNT